MFLSWGTLDDIHDIPIKLTGVDRELGLEKAMILRSVISFLLHRENRTLAIKIIMDVCAVEN